MRTPGCTDSPTTLARNRASCARRRSPTISIRGLASPSVAATLAASCLLPIIPRSKSSRHYSDKAVVTVGIRRKVAPARRIVAPAVAQSMAFFLLPIGIFHDRPILRRDAATFKSGAIPSADATTTPPPRHAAAEPCRRADRPAASGGPRSPARARIGTGHDSAGRDCQRGPEPRPRHRRRPRVPRSPAGSMPVGRTPRSPAGTGARTEAGTQAGARSGAGPQTETPSRTELVAAVSHVVCRCILHRAKPACSVGLLDGMETKREGC